MNVCMTDSRRGVQIRPSTKGHQLSLKEVLRRTCELFTVSAYLPVSRRTCVSLSLLSTLSYITPLTRPAPPTPPCYTVWSARAIFNFGPRLSRKRQQQTGRHGNGVSPFSVPVSLVWANHPDVCERVYRLHAALEPVLCFACGLEADSFT